MIADGVLTNILIQKNIGHESNPFLVDIAGQSRLIIIKILGILLASLILWDIHTRHPKLAFWSSLGFLILYCGIVGWNAHLLIRYG